MNAAKLGEIDLLLQQWSTGDESVENQLITLLYDDIHRLAHFQLKSNSASAMQTTEVVNAAFIKLCDQKSVDWQNKDHFMAITAKVIRRVIVDQYRAEFSQKRGGMEQHVTIERVQEFISNPTVGHLNWLELDEFIQQLEQIDPSAAKVMEYKVFGGMTIPEMARVMAVSESTISRDWKFARSWLIMQCKD